MVGLTWGSVRGRPNEGAHEAAVGEDVGKAKVGDLDATVVRQQQVLQLQVAMHDALVVAVVQGREHLASAHGSQEAWSQRGEEGR